MFLCFGSLNLSVFLVTVIPNFCRSQSKSKQSTFNLTELAAPGTSMWIHNNVQRSLMFTVQYESDGAWRRAMKYRFLPRLLPKLRHGEADSLVWYEHIRVASFVFIHAPMMLGNTRGTSLPMALRTLTDGATCPYRWRYVPFLVKSHRNTNGSFPITMWFTDKNRGVLFAVEYMQNKVTHRM
jgi:hypothetical protein